MKVCSDITWFRPVAALDVETEDERVGLRAGVRTPVLARPVEQTGVGSEGQQTQAVCQHLVLHDARVLHEGLVRTQYRSFYSAFALDANILKNYGFWGTLMSLKYLDRLIQIYGQVT